jgi:hypothetical protein
MEIHISKKIMSFLIIEFPLNYKTHDFNTYRHKSNTGKKANNTIHTLIL